MINDPVDLEQNLLDRRQPSNNGEPAPGSQPENQQIVVANELLSPAEAEERRLELDILALEMEALSRMINPRPRVPERPRQAVRARYCSPLLTKCLVTTSLGSFVGAYGTSHINYSLLTQPKAEIKDAIFDTIGFSFVFTIAAQVMDWIMECLCFSRPNEIQRNTMMIVQLCEIMLMLGCSISGTYLGAGLNEIFDDSQKSVSVALSSALMTYALASNFYSWWHRPRQPLLQNDEERMLENRVQRLER